ncbi:MAG: hypothetical protein IJ729_08265 [Alloprevotella sp.]|nr:hypothetical protein [Alloprevotella sp.]
MSQNQSAPTDLPTRMRDTNMELLRIAAMLLVLIIHADFFALGEPSHADTVAAPLSSAIRYLVQAACSCCVDVFVLLSGWYGIRFRTERLAGFAFQVLFFAIIGFALGAVLSPDEALTRHGVGSILLLDGSDYTFFKSYVALYLFAPLLNGLVARLERRDFRRLLAALYTMMWLYGWLFDGSQWHLEDDSPFAFMLLYLTARYLRLHCPRICNAPRGRFLLLYAGSAAISAAVMFLGIRLWRFCPPLLDYNSPFVIAAAIGLLLFFTRLRVRSRWIGWVAASCFAVYLFHGHRLLLHPVYAEQIRAWYHGLPGGMFVGFTLLWIILWFITAIGLDRVRIGLWNFLLRHTIR